MKVKRIDPKKIFRVRKKGKTRGRPSNVEGNAGKLLDCLYEQNKAEIDKVIADAVVFGTGFFKVKP